MKFMTLLFALLASPIAHAAQSIECKFVDPTNKDQVMVSLTTTQLGTFYYLSLDDDDGDSASKLTLRRVNSFTPSFAAYSAQVLIPDTQGSVVFTFEFPEALLLKPGNDIKAKLSTAIFGIQSLNRINTRSSTDSQDLLCSAKIL